MHQNPKAAFLALALAAALSSLADPATAAVAYLGLGEIPGTARDGTGDSSLLEDGVTPKDLAGGFGSGLAHLGGNTYVAVPDRGPADGTTRYQDRLYTLRINVAKVGASYVVKPSLVDAALLTQTLAVKGAPAIRHFTGANTAYDNTGAAVQARVPNSGSLRFDPEGVRVSQCGTSVFISDEYGPYLYEFNRRTGRLIRNLPVPNKFLVDNPSNNAGNSELLQNVAGRQSNRGMEGLAISPDGAKLYGIMQSPLLQDGALTGTSRDGYNVRILETDVATGAHKEYLYQLSDKGNGISEIVAVNGHELLVLERDGKKGSAAVFKKIFKIDLTGATDIRAKPQLPKLADAADPLLAGVQPVSKALFIDMLDPAYGLAGDSFPEKLEGLAFGPDLADGRHLLIVSSDNDFDQANSSKFFAFGIDAADLDYQAQDIGCAE